MPSPFPGMDPYIEQPALWPDFRGNLADRLPVLPVPLLDPDPDAAVDLGETVAAVYERGT